MKLCIDKALSADVLSKYEEKVKKATLMLENGSGKGNDFLGWLHLPSSISDEELNAIQAVADRLKKSCDVVVVAGIGGSYLGAKAVISALSNSFVNKAENAPEILFAGNNISEDYLAELMDYLSDKKFGIINISKC